MNKRILNLRRKFHDGRLKKILNSMTTKNVFQQGNTIFFKFLEESNNDTKKEFLHLKKRNHIVGLYIQE